MDDQDLFRGKKQIWKIDGNWHLDRQFIRVCTCDCESTGTVLDPYHCTRCSDTFTSYLDYLSHTCTPRRLYQCCSCRHLYVTEEEFDSHDCRPCLYPSDSVDDNACSDTPIEGEVDLSLETMKHTNSPGIFSAATEENSDGLLQKIKKEEINSDADSSQTEEMEGEIYNSNMIDLPVNEGGLHATGLESASHSQDHETSASKSDIATESQEQALQEAGVLQDKNKRRQKSSPAREKRVYGTRVRKRKWGREHSVIKQDVEGQSEVILSQIAGVEGRAGVTKKSLVSKVVESEIQRMISTKRKNGGEETEAGNPGTGSEGEMDLSVEVKTEKDITGLSRNSIFTRACSEEVSHSQSGPHNEVPEVPVIESDEKEDSRCEKEMHGLSKSSRNTAAGPGHSEAKLVFQKLGISNIPNPGKEFKVFKLMASDPFKDAKSTSIISLVQHPKPVTSTPTKGVKNNRSLIRLLSTPPTDYTSQHALQTSLLPCNNVLSTFPNSYVGSSSQTGQNPDSVVRGCASATGLSTLTNDSISTSQQEGNTDSQFSEEGLDTSIVKSESMYESNNDSEHVDDVPQTPDPEREPIITTIKSEPMDDYSYNIPHSQTTDIDHAVEGQKPFIKGEAMEMFDIPQTQDNDSDSTIEGQNPSIKSEPIEDSYNLSAGYLVNQNDTPEAIEESIHFTNLKKEPENDSSNFTQNQYDIPHSGVTAEGYKNLTTVKTEPGEESSDLSSCYSENQNVLHSQVTEEKQNLAIVNAVNAALENSGIPPELLYGENEREQTLPTEKRTGSDTGQFWLYNCKTCGKKFKHAGTLMVHERAHNLEKKQYQCFICGRICTAASYLKVHLRTHKEEPTDTTKRKIQCFKCDEQFLHEKNFQTHMRMHFQKGLTYCIKCGKGFYRKNQLDKHMENHTDKYPCKHCGREFSSQAGRTIHLNSHNKEKQTSKHPTDKFPCEQCGKQFSSAANRAIHLTIHNRDKETINCPICDKVFEKNLVKYESHLREHELSTLFLCPVCGHGFSTKGELTYHQKKHLQKTEGVSSHVLNAVRGLVSQRQ